jgi:thiosulfate/3-mercaptopyruvate sulfurtransferase
MIATAALLLTLAVQGPRDPMLVTTQWLAQHLHDPNLVVLHVGPRASYDSSHIAGARFVLDDDLTAPSDTSKPAYELPSPARLDSALEALGISDDSRIVIYQSNNFFTPATRIYLTLFWGGLGARTSILDGGFAAWRAANGAVDALAPAPRRGSLTIHPRSDVVVPPEFVLAHLGDTHVALIDARNTSYFLGNVIPNDFERRPGHIPGAFNIPWRTVVGDSGRFKSAAELADLFRSVHAETGDTLVSYCHLGMYGTMVWFAAKLAGYDARLYDGSFSQWSTRTNNPVERLAP